jgi:hypothetical protein
MPGTHLSQRTGSPGVGISVVMSCLWVLGWNPGPLQEQTLLTAEASLALELVNSVYLKCFNRAGQMAQSKHEDWSADAQSPHKCRWVWYPACNPSLGRQRGVTRASFSA